MNVASRSGDEYQVGGSLCAGASTYVVRKADSELCQQLRIGKFCYVLNSRQMGKSSLRVRTMATLGKEGFACSAIQIREFCSQGVTQDEFYGGLVSHLVSEFDLDIDPGDWWYSHNPDYTAPSQRLKKFVEEELLERVESNIVIFVDEIDSVLRLGFKDDFFAFVRGCYEKRAYKPKYNRLAFALLGVATPADLIKDRNNTLFNIDSQAVELTGFELDEATPLESGLSEIVGNPKAVLKEVLEWTGGQPFLTQWICQLVLTNSSLLSVERVAESLENIVRSQVINNWLAQDRQQHFQTIRARLLKNEQHTCRLLGLYQQILQRKEIAADNSSEQMELQLSGLVVKEQGKLRVYNRIYKFIFDDIWVNKELRNLRPYPEALAAWEASNDLDSSHLLREQDLQNALEWADGKSLSDLDYRFLAASQKWELAEAQQKLKEAHQELKRQIRKGSTFLVMSLVGSIAAVGLAVDASLRSQRFEIKALNSSSETLRSSNQLPEALIKSVKAGRQLRGIITGVPDKLEAETASLLQQVIDTIQSRLEGHKGEVTGVSFSPDSQIIASASEDKTVKLWSWDGKESKEIDILEGHNERVWSVSFSPYHQKKTIATTSWDGTIKLWSWDGKKSRKLVTLIGHQGWVFSVSFSPDRKTIASVGTDKMVRLWSWNGKEGKLQKSWQSRHKTHIVDVAFSPKDSNIIVTASDDGTAKLWNQNGTLLRTLKGHLNQVNGVSFSPDGNIIATASDDGTAKLWNQNGTLLRTLEGHSERVMNASFSADGQTIATASFDKTVKLWKLDGTQHKTLQHHNDWVWDANFSPDGETLASASRDRTIRLWKINSSKQQLLELDKLLLRGCQLLHDYLKTKPNVQQRDRRLCDGIENEKGFYTRVF